MRTLKTESGLIINTNRIDYFFVKKGSQWNYEIRCDINGSAFTVLTICNTIQEVATETECVNYAGKVFAKFQCWISDDVPCKNVYQFRDMLFSDFTDDVEEGNERYKWLCNQG